MKKVLLLVAVAGMFAFAACNQTPKTETPATPEEVVAPEVAPEEAPETELPTEEAPAEVPAETPAQ